MSSKSAIEIRGLGKAYRVGRRERGPETMAGAVLSWAKSPLRNYRQLQKLTNLDDADTATDVVWALRDVDLEIPAGDVVGLIGHNGAGKSTLLKVLSRITTPTRGEAVLRGRVGSLLEVGTGFHPDLTGRENVYLNGTILGMKRREISAAFDQIVEFAELGEFIETPVKRYSTGMYLRLAFSVAAHLQTEILLVDEVLAVGDISFQLKCLGKIGEVSREGRTVVFVSHNLATINDLCPKSVLINHGRVQAMGDTADVVDAYLALQTTLAHEYRPSDVAGKKLQLESVELLDSTGRRASTFRWDEPIVVRLTYGLPEQLKQARVGFQINDRRGQYVLRSGDSDWVRDLFISRGPGRFVSECHVPAKLLNQGDYTIALRCDIPQHEWLWHEDRILRFSVGSVPTPGGAYRRAAVRPDLEWAHREISK